MKTSYLTANDIDLVTAAQDGDTLAATELYRRYLSLIHATARTFFTRDRDELLAVIRFAFWEAVGRYDKSRGVPVAGYLKAQLRYAAWNACAKRARTEQRENGGELARELHCTSQAISALKRRALNALRQKLAAYAPDKP